MNSLLCLLFILSLTLSVVLVSSYSDRSSDTERSFRGECLGQYNATCLKLDMLSLVDKIAEHKEFNIFPSISLIRESENDYLKSGKILADILKNNPNDTEKRLNQILIAKVSTLLSSYSLRIKLVDNQWAMDNQNSSSGRKKIGKKGGLEAIIAAAMMMKGTLLSLAIGGIALLAGKALITSVMALVLAAATGLKSLASGGKETTYEIVAKPIYSSSHSHSTSHEDAQGGHSGYVRYKRMTGFQ